MKNNYTKLAMAEITETRKVVISLAECEGKELGFTIAQQAEIIEGKEVRKVFLKNSIHVDGINELYGLRDALNLAIENYEKM